jgi:transposase-like protein
MNTQEAPKDRDFRVRVVREIIESGADLHQVATELGVIPRQLGSWLRRYAVVCDSEGGTWRLKTRTEGIQELRRDIEQLKQELDHLRQVTSVSLFSLS